MKTLIILFGKIEDELIAATAIRELAAFNKNYYDLLIYRLDFTEYKMLTDVLSELWPCRLNVFTNGEFGGAGQTIMHTAHLAIKLDADVYQVGDDTGVEQVFNNMGIEVTPLPLQ